MLIHFKVIGKTQVKLHSLKVKKLDVCIRPLLQIRSHVMFSGLTLSN